MLLLVQTQIKQHKKILSSEQTGYKIPVSGAHILEMGLSTEQERGILAVQCQRQSEVTENRSNEMNNEKCIVCSNF